MGGSGTMLKGGIKSVKLIEEVLEDREGQRETKFPELCPSTSWHSQAIGSMPQLSTCTLGEPSPSSHQWWHVKMSEVPRCFRAGDLVQGQVGGFPPLTLSKAKAT